MTSCDNSARQVTAGGDTLVASDFAGATSCPVDASLSSIEGPYFYCVEELSSDLADGHPGTPLLIGFRILNASDCQPVEAAFVDVWHCDAGGRYAGYDVNPDIGATVLTHVEPVKPSEIYCRGVQRSNADGIVGFSSIFPGWYSGRAVHIHFKVQLGNLSVVTHQLVLPQDRVDKVQASAPYLAPDRTGQRVTADQDAIQDRFTVTEKNGVLLAVANIFVTAV